MSDEDGGDGTAAQRSKAQRREEKRMRKKQKKEKEAVDVVEERENEDQEEVEKPSKKRKVDGKVESGEAKVEETKEEDADDGLRANRVRKTADGDEYIDLSAKRRLTVRVWQGGVMVDVREMYEKHGEQLPGKKGIALNLQQWKTLLDSLPDIEHMIQRAKR